MSCTDLDSLWKEYFRDPLQFWDTRGSKSGPRSPDFRHKQTREPLWMESRYNPPWVQEELRRSGRKEAKFCVHTSRSEDDSLKIQEFRDSASLLDLIKACGKQKDLHNGSRVHADLLKRGLLRKDIYFGTALLHMYAKCGALSKAREVFDELPTRDVASWNALITGYAHHGHGDEALTCLRCMQHEGLFPSAVTFVCLLKACSSIGAAKRGEELHAEIGRQGLLENDVVLGTALVDMYAKCGVLTKAQAVFNELSERDVASWNALIAGYTQHGLASEVMSCFEKMQDEGLSPDAVTFVCILQVCGSIGAAEKGEEIHSEINRQGLLEKNVVLGTALLDMYAKCGVLAKAQEVFDELPARDVACWNTLIAGYTQHGLGDKALNCYGRMRKEGLSPNAVTFVYVLNACGSIGAIEKGEEIHTVIDRQGLLTENIVLGNALVDMYAKCGALVKAQEVLEQLPVQDVASWNGLISGYAQHGLGDEALRCYGLMQDKGFSPDAVTFISVLKACSIIGASDKGEEIHAEVDRQGLSESHIVLGNTLVDMYAKWGALAKAQEVFDKLLARDVISWNALIAGYANHGLGDEALNHFERMREEGISPNTITFIGVLKACGTTRAAEKGKKIHIEVSGHGLLEKRIMLGNALVDMYAKCGVLSKAQETFDELRARDVASWNALITGYVQHGLGEEALKCYPQMQEEGISPDAVTFLCVLKACGSIGAAKMGEEIHAEVGRQGLLEEHIVLGTALVDMYAKCGALAKAQEVFDKLPIRDVVSWTVLISGYAQQGLGDEALNCFEQMQDEGISPEAITFVCTLKACGIIGAIETGEEIHAKVSRQGLLKMDMMLGYALVDMYAKCGVLAKAQEVFNELPTRDVVSWTALIAGYAQVGKVRRVFDSFTKMIGERIEPNVVTFIVLLSACSHAGLVEEGQMFFDAMRTIYCIIPILEHHACMVDLFSRAGLFDKAISVIEKVPHSDRLFLWSALLGACRKWANAELGRWAFEHAVRLDKNYAGAYVCMSNIYAAADMYEEVGKVETLQKKMELKDTRMLLVD